MAIVTSVKIKKFWTADVAQDGGAGTNWEEIQIGQREASVKLNGSDAATNNYKNVQGSLLESSSVKGDMTLNFQLADLTPENIAKFTGGTVTTDANSVKFSAPINPNQIIEKSVKILTGGNVLVTIPRVVFDGYPMINDDDLHYYMINGVVLQPDKTTIGSYTYEELLLPNANDIITFVIPLQTGSSTIDAVAHTVAVTMPALTVVTALVPVIGVSLGASILPISGEAQNFTAPVIYAVESANGAIQNWTVTVTVTP